MNELLLQIDSNDEISNQLWIEKLKASHFFSALRFRFAFARSSSSRLLIFHDEDQLVPMWTMWPWNARDKDVWEYRLEEKWLHIRHKAISNTDTNPFNWLNIDMDTKIERAEFRVKELILFFLQFVLETDGTFPQTRTEFNPIQLWFFLRQQ